MRERIFNALIFRGYSMGKLSLDRVAIDGTTIRARKGGVCRLRWI